MIIEAIYSCYTLPHKSMLQASEESMLPISSSLEAAETSDFNFSINEKISFSLQCDLAVLF